MSNAITHTPHAAPWNLSVLRGVFGVAVHYLGRGLSNNDEAHDDGLLSSLVFEELFFAQTGAVLRQSSSA